MNVLFESPLGALLARPWLDDAGLFGLKRYMPLSRLWAAANAAGEDVARFRDQVGAPLPSFWSSFQLRPLLARHDRRRRAADVARQAWETAIFDPQQASDAGQLDRRRRRVATLHQMTRGYFYPLLFPRRPPLALLLQSSTAAEISFRSMISKASPARIAQWTSAPAPSKSICTQLATKGSCSTTRIE